MTYRNCIRLLALLLFLSGCSESESPPTTDKGEQRPADVEAQIDPVGDEPITNSIGMKLKLLPAGTFVMGSHADDAFPAEKPVHKVALTKPFHIGVHEVTQQQYEKVTGENPSNFQSPQNPVNEVSWNDAVQFCQKLSELPEEKAAGLVYRLPTEAEWEYACRAGASMQYSFGDHESRGLRDYAWFNENSGGEVHPVARRSRTVGDCTTCTGMSWSGAMIGLVNIRAKRRRIQRVHLKARSGCSAAEELPRTLQEPVGRRSVAEATSRAAIPASVFAWSQFHRASSKSGVGTVF